MSAGASLEGADELVRTLHGAADALGDLSSTHDKAGALLRDDARSNAPVKSGELADSHSYDVIDGGHVQVVVAADHARPVHAVNPWFADTLAADIAAVEALYTADVTDVLAAVKGT